MTLDASVQEFQEWASRMLEKPVKFQEDPHGNRRYVHPEMNLQAQYKCCWVQSAEVYSKLAYAAHAAIHRMPTNPQNIQWIQQIPENCDWVIAVQGETAHEFLRRFGAQHGLVHKTLSDQACQLLSKFSRYGLVDYWLRD